MNTAFVYTVNVVCKIGICLPLQAAVCTCSVLCAEQSGAGCVESAGTMSVWETTGLDNKTHTFSISRKSWDTL